VKVASWLSVEAVNECQEGQQWLDIVMVITPSRALAFPLCNPVQSSDISTNAEVPRSLMIDGMQYRNGVRLATVKLTEAGIS